MQTCGCSTSNFDFKETNMRVIVSLWYLSGRSEIEYMNIVSWTVNLLIQVLIFTTPTGMSDEDKQLIVDEHNRVRRAVYPTAKNMREIVSLWYLSSLMTKPTKWHVHPAKTQISMDIRTVWSESLLCVWRKLGSHWAHSEDTNQTGRMPRMIWVFAGLTVILLVLSWDGSFVWKIRNSIWI